MCRRSNQCNNQHTNWHGNHLKLLIWSMTFIKGRGGSGNKWINKQSTRMRYYLENTSCLRVQWNTSYIWALIRSYLDINPSCIFRQLFGDSLYLWRQKKCDSYRNQQLDFQYLQVERTYLYASWPNELGRSWNIDTFCTDGCLNIIHRHVVSSKQIF